MSRFTSQRKLKSHSKVPFLRNEPPSSSPILTFAVHMRPDIPTGRNILDGHSLGNKRIFAPVGSRSVTPRRGGLSLPLLWQLVGIPAVILSYLLDDAMLSVSTQPGSTNSIINLNFIKTKRTENSHLWDIHFNVKLTFYSNLTLLQLKTSFRLRERQMAGWDSI